MQTACSISKTAADSAGSQRPECVRAVPPSGTPFHTVYGVRCWVRAMDDVGGFARSLSTTNLKCVLCAGARVPGQASLHRSNISREHLSSPAGSLVARQTPVLLGEERIAHKDPVDEVRQSPSQEPPRGPHLGRHLAKMCCVRSTWAMVRRRKSSTQAAGAVGACVFSCCATALVALGV